MTTPRISYMGEEVPYDEYPGTGAVELADHFKPVTLSPRAINEASKIVPIEAWQSRGIVKWLQLAADSAFKNMPSGDTQIKHYAMRYMFEYGADGPVLRSVSL